MVEHDLRPEEAGRDIHGCDPLRTQLFRHPQQDITSTVCTCGDNGAPHGQAQDASDHEHCEGSESPPADLDAIESSVSSYA